MPMYTVDINTETGQDVYGVETVFLLETHFIF